ncbi:MAG: hypothetical protein Q8R47_05755 [Nanoarchaeota archaeon]|nr:hypothetical protein [Nanoarchaeota archaeon]
MRDQEKILYFLKVVGPTIPSKVAKNINTEILLASAHLSDLAAQGKVKISNLKIGGGSPLYYLHGQEEQLYHFAAGNLNPKDYQVLEILRQQKIMRENSLDLLSRVALRSLKDFAIPLHVTVGEKKELFWKWHLLSDEEASASIKQLLFVREQTAPFQTPHDPEGQQSLSPAISEQAWESQTKLENASELQNMPAVSLEQEELLEETDQQQGPAEELQQKIEKVLSQAKSKSPRTKMISKKPKLQEGVQDKIQDNFFPSTESFLAGKGIIIQEKEIVRKNTEVNLLIKVPSAVGTVTYFCKAKKKARCDEGDVSAAYMEAQIKKLPLLFLYTHELTKKAQEMLAAEAFQNALVAKLERGDGQ